jgi:transcriptional regulator with XRE-family HTH domain
MFELSSLEHVQSFPTKPLSKHLKWLRNNAGLSQRELADWMNAAAEQNKLNNGEEPELKITKHTISYVECGKCDPSDYILGLYSAALGIPLEHILYYDTRFPEKKLRALLAKDPNWAHILNEIIRQADTGAVPVHAMSLLRPDEDPFYEDEIVNWNARRFSQLDILPPKMQKLVLSIKAVYEYEEFTDRYMIHIDAVCNNTTKGQIILREDKYPGDWNICDGSSEPYMPAALKAVYDANILTIAGHIKDCDYRPTTVIITGDGNIRYSD